MKIITISGTDIKVAIFELSKNFLILVRKQDNPMPIQIENAKKLPT
tara:strand:+ start:1331 stop:1468 length:138 start_codon:yes stop_codon:yes gene_type:complete